LSPRFADDKVTGHPDESSDELTISGENTGAFRTLPRPTLLVPLPGGEYVFSVAFTSVAAAILAAVEGGILPPGLKVRNGSAYSNHTPIPPGRMPGSTAGRMPAATLNTYAGEGQGEGEGFHHYRRETGHPHHFLT
jgi:hypothetical protein